MQVGFPAAMGLAGMSKVFDILFSQLRSQLLATINAVKRAKGRHVLPLQRVDRAHTIPRIYGEAIGGRQLVDSFERSVYRTVLAVIYKWLGAFLFLKTSNF